MNKMVKISHTVGLFWCIIQGLTRGAMYSGQKIAMDATKVDLAHIILIRSLYIMLGAYCYGKISGADFSISVYTGFNKTI